MIDQQTPNAEEVQMADESRVLEVVKRYFEFVGADVERADEIYHDDAVLEFPQSGERFEGVATFTQWRRQYPADPNQMRYRVRRVTARVDLAVVEVSVSYDGTRWMQGVQLLEFHGDKVARERIYVMDAWEAPEWRAPWRSETPADPSNERDFV
jgi:ketosteroid isomerase-like protein